MTAAFIELEQVTSSSSIVIFLLNPSSSRAIFKFFPLISLIVAITWKLLLDNNSAINLPKPELAPVIKTTLLVLFIFNPLKYN